MTIQKKLPLFLAILVTISLIVTSLFVYFFTSKMLKNEALNKVSINCNLGTDDINSLIISEKKEVELLSQQKDIVDISKIRKSNSDDSFFSTYINHKSFTILKNRASTLKDHEHLFVLDLNGEIFADSNTSSLKLDLKSRKYFQDALKGKASISDTIISKANGKSIIVFVYPVKDDFGNVIAVMANSVYTDYFTNKLKNIKIGNTGYAYLVDKSGLMLSHPLKEKINKKIENSKILQVVSRINKGETIKLDTGCYNINGITEIMSYNVVPEVDWVFAVTQSATEANSAANLLLKIILAATAVSAIISIFLGYVASKKITLPINELMGLMDKAANGDITVISHFHSKDELGNLSANFNKMISNIKSLIIDIDEAILIVMNGAELLTKASKENVESISQVSFEIENIAKGANYQAKETDCTYNLFEKFGELIDTASIMNLKINEYSSSIKESNSNGKAIVKDLQEKNNAQSKLSNNLTYAIENLDKKSLNIKDITHTISDIAEQTNLLSLNAAIEAAKSGKQGNGFAVVADEIKKLANQSKSAAEEISLIIGEIQNKMHYSVNTAKSVELAIDKQTIAVSNTEKAFDTISEKICNIASKIDESSKLFSELKNNKNVMLNSVQNISSICEKTAASSEEVSASTEQQTASMESISVESENLKNQIIKLKEASKLFKIR
ncbi:methyl-accepting chemotaxis protein [Clostridium drakei]|nr:methyl-accepting chemotaxis protein [Clostridium drakei]